MSIKSEAKAAKKASFTPNSTKVDSTKATQLLAAGVCQSEVNKTVKSIDTLCKDGSDRNVIAVKVKEGYITRSDRNDPQVDAYVRGFLNRNTALTMHSSILAAKNLVLVDLLLPNGEHKVSYIRWGCRPQET